MVDLAFGMPGTWEWIWIALIFVLLFGARKLPELARAMGTSITQFRKGLKEEDQADEGKDKDQIDEGKDAS